MELGEAIFLGVVQGATEFLPISSSGHLILTEALLGIQGELAFEAFIHLGTLLAVLIYFRRDWLTIFSSFKNPGLGRSLFLMLCVGTIPGALAGLFLEDIVSAHFRTPERVAFMLILMSFPLLAGELFGRKHKKIRELGLLGAGVIGLAQALALIPGTSRSGITMATGLLLGLSRAEAAHFSFLLSAPIIAGAGLFEGFKIVSSGKWPAELLFSGTLAAFLSGWLAISFLLQFLKTRTFYPFVVYRLLIAMVVYALV